MWGKLPAHLLDNVSAGTAQVRRHPKQRQQRNQNAVISPPTAHRPASQPRAGLAPTEKVFDAVAAPRDSAMASPRTKIIGPHKSQLRSAADC